MPPEPVAVTMPLTVLIGQCVMRSPVIHTDDPRSRYLLLLLTTETLRLRIPTDTSR
jgi:hypothetical protein